MLCLYNGVPFSSNLFLHEVTAVRAFWGGGGTGSFFGSPFAQKPQYKILGPNWAKLSSNEFDAKLF